MSLHSAPRGRRERDLTFEGPDREGAGALTLHRKIPAGQTSGRIWACYRFRTKRSIKKPSANPKTTAMTAPTTAALRPVLGAISPVGSVSSPASFSSDSPL